MTLEHIRDKVAGLSIEGAAFVGMAKLPADKTNALCVYKRDQGTLPPAMGGRELRSYGVYPIRVLIHGTQSPRGTEVLANNTAEALNAVEDDGVIKWIDASEPISVGTDDAGIYEWVVNATLYYRKE